MQSSGDKHKALAKAADHAARCPPAASDPRLPAPFGEPDTDAPRLPPPATASAYLEEIPAAAVCRPQLFLRPEVAGLTESTTVSTPDGPAGRWLLCTQWRDRRREMILLTPSLARPDVSPIWLSPIPHPPPPGVIPGWSAAGRQRWLQGHTPDLSRVFGSILEQVHRFILFPDEVAAGAPAIVALWIMLTYCFPAWPAIPYLHITGPLGSGKSRLLDLVARLAWRRRWRWWHCYHGISQLHLVGVCGRGKPLTLLITQYMTSAETFCHLHSERLEVQAPVLGRDVRDDESHGEHGHNRCAW